MKTANDTEFVIPMFDPVVANHFASVASHTGTLLHQIEVEQIYAPLFQGRKGLTFLDIGANIGLVSIYAAPSCKRIVALEPAKDTFAVLQAMTIKVPVIEPVCAALAPVDGEVTFYTNDVNSTASSTVNTYGTKTSVPGMTLAGILSVHQLEQVDVLKCDAEAGEGESLSIEQLEHAAPIVAKWYVETHNCPVSTWEHKLGTLAARFCRLGYRIRAYGMTIEACR